MCSSTVSIESLAKLSSMQIVTLFALFPCIAAWHQCIFQIHSVPTLASGDSVALSPGSIMRLCCGDRDSRLVGTRFGEIVKKKRRELSALNPVLRICNACESGTLSQTDRNNPTQPVRCRTCMGRQPTGNHEVKTGRRLGYRESLGAGR
ncbi:hypothetical protein B0T20DRAFT_223429 [Sordaria brevicollis]|uniref:Uncharacterized protein n=1 Tax=Sordaria brevicollis TaxID=83679 RepID=A0AAE0UB27_SORBR|nr:hypothetical protein B0T20DRAFT_223429 [Sordaria brevicollis]